MDPLQTGLISEIKKVGRKVDPYRYADEGPVVPICNTTIHVEGPFRVDLLKK